MGEEITGVYQFYQKTGKYVNKFDTIKEAADTTGVNANTISLCCNGKATHAGGYIWVKRSCYR